LQERFVARFVANGSDSIFSSQAVFGIAKDTSAATTTVISRAWVRPSHRAQIRSGLAQTSPRVRDAISKKPTHTPVIASASEAIQGNKQDNKQKLDCFRLR
jgi:hypothetical protein